MKNVEVPDIFSDVFNDKLKTFSVDSRTTVSPHPFSLVAVKAASSKLIAGFAAWPHTGSISVTAPTAISTM